jgi:hypothetical protein
VITEAYLWPPLLAAPGRVPASASLQRLLADWADARLPQPAFGALCMEEVKARERNQVVYGHDAPLRFHLATQCSPPPGVADHARLA